MIILGVIRSHSQRLMRPSSIHGSMNIFRNLMTFNVRRYPAELILPAKPTPREMKTLSDIDDQEGLRFHIPLFHFYNRKPKMGNKNPASVIREALAKVLVFYYPLAGRLKEGPGRKLLVDCSNKGVLFVEAEADVTLKQFGVDIQPPFPCREKLICHVPGSGSILEAPLLLIQVTRLRCGGFILAIQMNHTICDGTGYAQFMTAISEIANGASTPSTLPTWQRELLCARDPPHVTRTHYEYDLENTNGTIISSDEMEIRSFFFGPTQISSLRSFLPTHLKSCTTFEVLTASLWRCRTIAIQPNPEDEMLLMPIVNARSRYNPHIPIGYYGNVFGFPAAISKARDLCNKPLSHVLKLVIKAKHEVTEEYMRSVTDLMVTKGRPNFKSVRSYIVSDVSHAGLREFDFGWGKAVYAGPDHHVASFYTRYVNRKGESGIRVTMCLPSDAMKRFVKEIEDMLVKENTNHVIQEHVLGYSI